jgi:hypothetical protein
MFPNKAGAASAPINRDTLDVLSALGINLDTPPSDELLTAATVRQKLFFKHSYKTCLPTSTLHLL